MFKLVLLIMSKVNASIVYMLISFIFLVPVIIPQFANAQEDIQKINEQEKKALELFSNSQSQYKQPSTENIQQNNDNSAQIILKKIIQQELQKKVNEQKNQEQTNSSNNQLETFPKVIVYEHNNFSGEQKQFNGSVPNIGPYWNDKISSVKVISGKWQFFDHENYDGASSKQVGPGDYNDVNIPEFNSTGDTITSFKVISLYPKDNNPLSSNLIKEQSQQNQVTKDDDQQLKALELFFNSQSQEQGIQQQQQQEQQTNIDDHKIEPFMLFFNEKEQNQQQKVKQQQLEQDMQQRLEQEKQKLQQTLDEQKKQQQQQQTNGDNQQQVNPIKATEKSKLVNKQGQEQQQQKAKLGMQQQTNSNNNQLETFPKVIVYEHNNFSGEQKQFNGSVPNIGPYWNDKISSVKVISGKWQFFDHENYDGASSKQVGPGDYNDVNIPEFNSTGDTITSFKVISLYPKDNNPLSSNLIKEQSQQNQVTKDDDQQLKALELFFNSQSQEQGIQQQQQQEQQTNIDDHKIEPFMLFFNEKEQNQQQKVKQKLQQTLDEQKKQQQQQQTNGDNQQQVNPIKATEKSKLVNEQGQEQQQQKAKLGMQQQTNSNNNQLETFPKVIVYEHNNFSGEQKQFNGSVPNIGP